MSEGFIKLNRKIFQNRFWRTARVFSEFEAWVDLISRARFEEPSEYRYIDALKKTIEIKNGQDAASIRLLASRWGWGERKVRTFLKYLQSEKMIDVSSDAGVNIITLCNFAKYNSNDTPKDTGNMSIINELRSQLTQLKTQADTATTQLKEYKELIETKEIQPKGCIKKAATNVATRKQVFYDSLVPFAGKYPKEMLRAFFDYWTELNISGSKMKFEMQKTWETSKRLATWAGKEPVKCISKPNFANHDNNKSYENF